MTRTRIKICGITTLEDALAAIELGADALGFNRIKESPRYVSDELLEGLISIPPFVSKVILIKEASEASEYSHLDSVQFQHYTESNLEHVFKHSRRHFRAFRVRNEETLEEMGKYPFRDNIAGYVLDAYHKTKLGGSGLTFDWSLAIEAQRRFPGVPILLAGGLTPENVAEAIRTVRPYAVDVSSGVEADVGRKCPNIMAAFFDAIREVDGSER